MVELTSEVASQWLSECEHELKEAEEYLSTLDEYVGDGDHGKHVLRGFKQIKADWPEDTTRLASIFHFAGSELVKDKESSSVHLYGEAFLEMSKHFTGNYADLDTLGQALQAAVEKMKKIGATKRGDKTLIDVWASVADSLLKQEAPTFLVFEDAAKSALKSSKYLVAQKGQAATYGSDSVGFLDPGIVSSYYIFNALTKVLERNEANSVKH